ncbi:alpha/beta fold hydrolase [Nitrospira defluvii]|nr:alpha/beta fold hydrolase [Nitrospira defluvii]
METRIPLALDSGDPISMILAEPDSPTHRIVLLCHGFMSSKNSSTNKILTERLLAKGIATCRFDFYGHAEDGHPFQEMTLSLCLKQVDIIFSWMTQKSFTQIGLLGSSYGGLVAILSAVRHPEILTLGLKCPVSEYPSLWHALLGEGGMAAWKSDGILSFAGHEGRQRLAYPFYEDLLRYEAYREAKSIQVPVLIVHGAADMDVPIEQSERLYETLSGKKEFERIEGADHRFEKKEDYEQMLERLFQWFAEGLKS